MIINAIFPSASFDANGSLIPSTNQEYKIHRGDCFLCMQSQRRFIIIGPNQTIMLNPGFFLFHPPIINDAWFEKYSVNHQLVFYGQYLIQK